VCSSTGPSKVLTRRRRSAEGGAGGGFEIAKGMEFGKRYRGTS